MPCLNNFVKMGLINRLPRNVFAGEPFSPDDPYFFYDPDTPLHPGQWNLDNQAPDTIHYPAGVAPNGHETTEATISNAGLDANIIPVWEAGYTGRGVTIGILDDGIELAHPDLDIIPELSTGMDAKGIVVGQTGGHQKDTEFHGTNVGGMAAAIGGNGIGVCGLAPHARIASVAVNNFTTLADYCMHPPAVYWQAGLGWKDQMDSQALSMLTEIRFAPVIQVKNSSSKTALFSYPDDFIDTYSAFARTAANGMLYTQAAGNSRGTEQQDANISMELTCPYIIGVAALGSNGQYALYSNFGASIFVTTLSESAWWNVTDSDTAAYANGLGVSTTDRFGTLGINYESNLYSVFLPDIDNMDYTGQFDGTSAAAPSLAGMLAVARQANPNLNLRMTKHLLAATSCVVDPDDRSASATWLDSTGRSYSGWQINEAGFAFNPNYGFGLPDMKELTGALLQTAYVTDESIYHTGLRTVSAPMGKIIGGDTAGVTQSIGITVPDELRQNLESVEVYLKIEGEDRREIQVVVDREETSSRLLAHTNGIGNNPLFDDNDPAGGIDHFFLSNAFWGENPNGIWSVTVSSPAGTHEANWLEWGIVLHMGELVYEGTQRMDVFSRRAILGLSQNQAQSHLLIPELQTVHCAGDVQLNAGRLEVTGVLRNADSITVSRLDPDFSSVTETLFYRRGMRVEVAGGMLYGNGTLIAPKGSDGRGGIFNRRGTVRPGENRAGGTLNLGTASEVTHYTQSSDGTLIIDVRDIGRYGRLEVNGNVKLDGTLEVVTRSDADIQAGDRIDDVISGETLSGQFFEIIADIPGTKGLHWCPVYGDKGLDLKACK